MSFGPDGKSLLAGGANHDVRLFDLAAETHLVATLASVQKIGHSSAIQTVAYPCDGRMFATSDVTGRILFRSPDLEEPLDRLQGHPGKVSAIVLPNSDQRLVSAGDDGQIRVWQWFC